MFLVTICSPPLLLAMQLLMVLTAMYVLEPLFTKVYMQNLLTGAEKVLAILRCGWGLDLPSAAWRPQTFFAWLASCLGC